MELSCKLVCLWFETDWSCCPNDTLKMEQIVQKGTKAFAKENHICFQVRQLQGDPLALSYWLASNLPLEDDTRQRLLEAPTVVERSVYGLCSALHF